MQILFHLEPPVLGSEFISWQTDQQISFSTDYSESNQTIEFRLVEDANLTAHFQPVDYNVSVALSTIDYFDDVIEDIPGEVLLDGNDTTFQIYHYNDEANLTALPSANFQFVRWLDSSNNTISTNQSYLPVIRGPISLTAVFQRKSFAVEQKLPDHNNSEGSISGLPSSGRLYFGESIELTANPVEHFQFLYWSDSSSETNPVAPLIYLPTSVIFD